MVFICIAIVLFWKAFKKTKFLKGHEVDLTSDLQDINDYTEEVSPHIMKAFLLAQRKLTPFLISVPRARGCWSPDLLDETWRQGLLSGRWLANSL